MNQLTEAPQAFDEARAEAFAGQVMDQLNAGAVCVMTGIGHRLGLFDAMTTLPPATSQEIAEAAGLVERYVREWLAVMVTGGVVVYDPAGRTYSLPAEHAAFLTRAAAPNNMAVYAQMVGTLAGVTERLVDCFREGGGTCYGDYLHFHSQMAEDSNQTVVAGLDDHILPLMPEVPARLDAGIDVLDAGCGRAGALLALAERFPASRFAGYDLGEDAIAHAREAAAAKGLANVRLEVRDLTGFDEPGSRDLVFSFDAVHDQKDPQGLLDGIYRALRPGGIYLMQDIGGSAHLENNLDFPCASLLYAVSTAHCTPISLGQGGEGLGTMWGVETAEAMLRRAGFERIERNVLPHDPMNVWFVCRK